VTEDEKRRAESVRSVPEQLQADGVNTVAAGRSLARWHSSGFDEYPEEALDVRRRRSIGQQLERISPKLRSAAGRFYETVTSLKQSAEDCDEVDDLLEALTDGRSYGFLHMMDPHMPCEPDPEIIEELLERREYPNQDLQEFFDTHADSPYIADFLANVATDADFDVGLARLFARYDGAVIEADRKVGRLVERLRDRDLLDDTIIIVTSDHGESLDEHGIYFDHHGLYDPSVRVPLIVSGPGTPTARREESVRLPDLAPTIADSLGIEWDSSGVGQSLRPLLGGSGEWDDRPFVVFSEAQAQRRVGIRTDRYKFIKHVADPVLERKQGKSFGCNYCNTIHGGERELYDLTRDPGENTNIVDEQPDVAAELEAKLDSYFNELEECTPESESRVTYDEEEAVLERLEDLGYK
jgi:arylsulfatase A-like enzyme